MSWAINLSINSTIIKFEKWFDEYLHNNYPFYSGLEKGKVRLRSGSHIKTQESDGTLINVIYGRLGTIDPIDPSRFIITPDFPALVYASKESSNDMLQVTAKCEYRGLLPYFVGLLESLELKWPETKTTVKRFIEQLPLIDEAIPESELSNETVYHELDINPASIKDVIRFILELHKELGEKTPSKEQPEGIIRWFELENRELNDNHLITNAERFVETDDILPTRVLCLDVFEFICVGIGNKVRIKATCRGNIDELLVNYFNELWLKFINFLPSEYTEQQVKDVIDKTEPTSKKAKSFRGRRSQYSMEKRDDTVRKWLSKSTDDARTLEVFLVDNFGEKDPDSFVPYPNVSKSAFYNWRRDYLDRNPEEE
jgi:hypothetical protein